MYSRSATSDPQSRADALKPTFLYYLLIRYPYMRPVSTRETRYPRVLFAPLMLMKELAATFILSFMFTLIILSFRSSGSSLDSIISNTGKKKFRSLPKAPVAADKTWFQVDKKTVSLTTRMAQRLISLISFMI